LEKRVPIRILLADHQALFRQGLRTLLAPERDCTVIGEAEDFQSLLAAVREFPEDSGDVFGDDYEVAGTTEESAAVHSGGHLTPDVIALVDDLPGLNSIHSLDLLREYTNAQFLMLTSGAEPDPALGNGWQLARIRRSEATSLLVPVVRQLVRQTSTLSLQNLSATVDRLRAANFAPAPVSSGPALTVRENEILQLLATGNTVKDAANELDLSVKTVEAHKFNLMRKLNIHTRADLVAYAQRTGITARPVPA
jgi:DNA-binding NarL/FixJ family response regulator